MNADIIATLSLYCRIVTLYELDAIDRIRDIVIYTPLRGLMRNMKTGEIIFYYNHIYGYRRTDFYIDIYYKSRIKFKFCRVFHRLIQYNISPRITINLHANLYDSVNINSYCIIIRYPHILFKLYIYMYRIIELEIWDNNFRIIKYKYSNDWHRICDIITHRFAVLSRNNPRNTKSRCIIL